MNLYIKGSHISIMTEDNRHIGTIATGEDFDTRFIDMLMEEFNAEGVKIKGSPDYISFSNYFLFEVELKYDDKESYCQTLSGH